MRKLFSDVQSINLGRKKKLYLVQHGASSYSLYTNENLQIKEMIFDYANAETIESFLKGVLWANQPESKN